MVTLKILSTEPSYFATNKYNFLEICRIKSQLFRIIITKQ